MRKKEIPGYDSLLSLALDMRWSWNHEADELWQELDQTLWEQTHNPCVILQTISVDHAQQKLADEGFRSRINDLLRLREASNRAVSWFEKNHSSSPLKCVAYFSMEFMLSEALPIYVGGLGNVAGDQLKSASDLGVPVIGVGLLYQQGYFRQVIDKNGEQEAYFPYNDPGQLPIRALRHDNGDWLRLQIPFPGAPVWVRAWEVQVGRIKLYLLDSNDPANLAPYRGITSEIYGGEADMRIKQEIILGIGGWMLLEALGVQPDVCHLNEGHAAFAILERARSFMEAGGLTFEEALTVTRAGNLFTTHTAVAAGFDHFNPALMEYHLGAYAADKLHLSLRELLALGRQNPEDPNESFNMAYLAINGSGFVNGVSRLHGLVSRHLFEPLFYRWPTEEIPVGHVTNGVHTPSWNSEEADKLWEKACGENRWLDTTESMTEKILGVDDARLWQMRNACRATLVDYIRRRTGNAQLFDPNTLTLGFARRFVSYKRPDLLLHDQDRLVRLLTNGQHPVQLVIAGKAPPSDQSGRDLIRRWIRFIREKNMYKHVLFLDDYDMLLAEHLVEGVDVWLNTPRRPWEASGTSGMKVLVNGGLNLSELDGWWAEAYRPEVGWALGDGKEHGEDPAWDAQEADTLYRILEEEVVPTFYNRDDQHLSPAWTEKMRQSMATLTPYFSTNRTVREYTEAYYVPGAGKYHLRAKDQSALGKKIVQWKQGLQQGWAGIRLGEAKVIDKDGQVSFDIRIHLGGAPRDAVSVELYAKGIDGGPAVHLEMKPVGLEKGADGAPAGSADSPVTYSVILETGRPADDYTVRVIPRCEGVSVPLENKHILWQR
jgi:starch phosphorylase